MIVLHFASSFCRRTRNKSRKIGRKAGKLIKKYGKVPSVASQLSAQLFYVHKSPKLLTFFCQFYFVLHFALIFEIVIENKILKKQQKKNLPTLVLSTLHTIKNHKFLFSNAKFAMCINRFLENKNCIKL